MLQNKKTKVLIVGGGFGGIKAALMLDKSTLFNVTMLTNDPSFRYYPRLYHTATGGGSNESEITLDNLFAKTNIKIIIDEAVKLKRYQKIIETKNSHEIKYDKLILALGVTTNYFGIKGLSQHSYGIKSIEEATELKKHLHESLVKNQKTDKNYIVIGAGPTGIELSGELKYYLDDIVKKHKLINQKINIKLIEAAPRLLPSLPHETSEAVAKRLLNIGVKLLVNHKVEGESADELIVDGNPIKSHTVIWTAGVTNSSFFKLNDFKLTDHGKVIVDDYLMAEDNIYVIGDNAATEYSGMAQTALSNALSVARNLIREDNNKPLEKFKSKRPIYVITVGRRWAAVVWGEVKINGWLGWILREMADLVAFHDLEPWWKAAQQWSYEFNNDNKCDICDHES